MKKIIFIIYIHLLLSQLVFAGAFDYVGLNARPSGMADSWTALAGNIDSIYYNPAGLVGTETSRVQFLLSYRDFYGLNLLSQRYAALSLDGRYVNVAFSWHRIGTTRNVKFISYAEDTYILTLAGKPLIIRNLLLGVNFKFYRVLSEINASGYGIDMGILYQMMDGKLSLGIALKNLNNTEIIWDSGAIDELNSDFNIGVSITPLNSIVVALDYNQYDKLSIGLELCSFNDKFALRGGLNNKTISSGAGINWKDLQFDYAITRHSELGWTHFFSLKKEIK